MSDDRDSRALTPSEPQGPQPPDTALTPAPEGERRAVERFSAGPTAHTAGLTEERGAQIVRQSANARTFVALAILLIALFIPVYWFIESGVPALGTEGRMTATAEDQYVTDVSRGYALFLANCATCHGDNGQGGVGPPLNNQPKLYNAITASGGSGTGHLNPDYITNVLTVGGRYVCGDASSLMPAFKEPGGPLNYRQVEELVAWITASSDVTFEYEPVSHGATAEPAEAQVVTGWRDPAWQPEAGATPVPACWRNPSGVIGGAAPAPTTAPQTGPEASVAPIEGGTADAPRVIKLQATADLHFVDESGAIVTSIEAVAGETLQFEVDNVAGFDHNFWIGTPDQLQVPNGTTDTGIPTWTSGVQTVTWTATGDGMQFACTVPGHYTSMHADIVISG